MTLDINPLALEALKKLEEMDFSEGGEGYSPPEADVNFSAEQGEKAERIYTDLIGEMSQDGFTKRSVGPDGKPKEETVYFFNKRADSDQIGFDLLEANGYVAQLLVNDENKVVAAQSTFAMRNIAKRDLAADPTQGEEFGPFARKVKEALMSEAAQKDIEAYNEAVAAGYDLEDLPVHINSEYVELGYAMSKLRDLVDHPRSADKARKYLTEKYEPRMRKREKLFGKNTLAPKGTGAGAS